MLILLRKWKVIDYSIKDLFADKTYIPAGTYEVEEKINLNGRSHLGDTKFIVLKGTKIGAPLDFWKTFMHPLFDIEDYKQWKVQIVS